MKVCARGLLECRSKRGVHRPSRCQNPITDPRVEWRRVRLTPFVCVGAIEMIVNTTKFTVQPEKRTEFLQTIGPLVEPIKSAKGCHDFGFYLDVADENSTLLVSEWETETDLNNYLGSNDFAILRGAITVLSVQSIDSKVNVTSHRGKP